MFYAPYQSSHPPAFRVEVVRLVRSIANSIPVVAKDLGVSDQALCGWVRRAEIDAGESDGLTNSEREELHAQERRHGDYRADSRGR